MNDLAHVAHVLTVFGFDEDGAIYHLECREPRSNFERSCVAWNLCGCMELIEACPKSPTGLHARVGGQLWMPTPFCWLATHNELDEAVMELLARPGERHDSVSPRGIYLVDYREVDAAPELIALAKVVGPSLAVNVGNSVLARPTRDARRPGFGPEADLRELIEEALCEEEGVTWSDDDGVIVVDASYAAEQVLAWITEQLPDSLSPAASPARRPVVTVDALL